MIPILLSWMLMFVSTAGIGAMTAVALSRLSMRVDPTEMDIFHVFWIGVAVTVGGAQLWNLFLPLNGTSLVFWFAASLLGQPFLCWILRGRNTQNRQCIHVLFWPRVCLLVICAAFLLYHGASGVAVPRWSGGAYDTDLYHFNSIRWMNEFPATPGLGNLHSRLAHSSGFLVFSALMDNLWWDQSTAWLTYGLLVSIASLQWLWTILAPGSGQRSRVFCLLTLPYVLLLQTSIYPTLHFDDIAAIIQLVLVLNLLQLLPSPKEAVNDTAHFTSDATKMVTVLTLAGLGFSIKPIGAISLLLVVLLAAWVLIRISLQSDTRWTTVPWIFIAVSAIPTIILVSHVIRNAILSGWLLYPAPVGEIDFDWTMPGQPLGGGHGHEMQSVVGQYNVIKAWARIPGPDYANALTGGFSVLVPALA